MMTLPASSRPADARTNVNVVFIHSRLDDYGLTPPQFRVYAHIARRASSGAAYPSVPNMALVCKLNPQTVRRALKVLVAHRLVTREPRPGTTPIYRLTPASQWQPPMNIKGTITASHTPPLISSPTLANTMQGRPSEMDIGEGNPVEGHPMKEHTHTKAVVLLCLWKKPYSQPGN